MRLHHRDVIEIDRESLFDLCLNLILLDRHRQSYDPVAEANYAVKKVMQGKRPYAYHVKTFPAFSSRCVAKEFGQYINGVWMSDSEIDKARKAEL